MNRDYLRGLLRAAWADDLLTPAEQAEIATVAQLLEIPAFEVERMSEEARRQ